MINFIPNNTPEWEAAHVGVFSSSEAEVLLKTGSRRMTLNELKRRDERNKQAKLAGQKADTRTTVDTIFGAGALTYINKKVAEKVNGKRKSVATTKPMERGIILEENARQLFCEITGIKMVESGLFVYSKYAVGTPDGHVIVGRGSKRRIKAICEIKCLNAENHSEICEMSTVAELRAYDESFYFQSQMNMLCTGAGVCYFISYDDRPLGYDDNGELDETLFEQNQNNIGYCIKIFKIKRDEKYIEHLKYVLLEAAILFNKKLAKRKKQANKIVEMYSKKSGTLNQLSA